MNISEERLKRVQQKLGQSGLDALFCRLSEHVLYFTGYWPRNHVGAAVVPANGPPVLLLSDLEAQAELAKTPASAGLQVLTSPLESEKVMRGPNDVFAAILPALFGQLGLEDKAIGVEMGIEGCNVGIFQGEVKYPAKPTWDLLKSLFPKADIRDGTGVIMELRAVKSEEEIAAIRLAVETAGFGYEAAQQAARPGMKETELAAVVESAIHSRGTGYQGILQARGYACAYTGERSATQWTHYAYSTERKVAKDDVIIIELGSFADGYWADLTRNYCAGTPPPKVKEMFRVALGAQRAAMDLARPGTPISDLDRAARQYMAKYGYAEYWPHGLGHGVGISYHEGPPLHMANHKPLQAGMVLTLEPGIYIPGLAGIRPEDMIVVRDSGAELISGGIPHALA